MPKFFTKLISIASAFCMLFASTPLSFYNSDSFPTTLLAFAKFYSAADKAFEIPDICGDFVPQGLCYSDFLGKYLVTGYMNSGGASPLYIVDSETGKAEKKVLLLNEDGSVYDGHAGGVAAFEANAWVVSGKYARRLPLATLAAAENGSEIRFADSFNSGTRASYISCDGKNLYVGEYYKSDGSYETDESHHLTGTDGEAYCAFTCAYKLTPGCKTGFDYDGSSSDVVTPDFILSTEDMCQGFACLGDGLFVTSISGSFFNSKLVSYNDVTKNEPDKLFDLNGAKIPLFFLDGNARRKTLSVLPRSEGLQYMPETNSVMVLFESAAEKMFINSFAATKNVWKVDARVF